MREIEEQQQTIQRNLKEAQEHNSELTELTDILFLQNNQLAELHKFAMEISEIDDLEGVSTLITTAAVTRFGAAGAALLLLDEESHELRVAAEIGLEVIDSIFPGNQPDPRVIDSMETGRVKYCNVSHGSLQSSDSSVNEWGLFPLKGRKSKLGVLAVELGGHDIRDSIAILANHGSMVIDSLMLNLRLQKETAGRVRAEEHVNVLSGLLPICCSCKKIRDDNGYWEQVEVYVREHSEAEFSHGICPDCIEKLYGKDFRDTIMNK